MNESNLEQTRAATAENPFEGLTLEVLPTQSNRGLTLSIYDGTGTEVARVHAGDRRARTLATLMAAAPALFSVAVQCATECGECGGSGCEDCAFIQEAIAKAQGRA